MSIYSDPDWLIGNSKCSSQHENVSTGFCQAIWDGYMCWPPTPPGEIVKLRCPQYKGIDTSQYAYRTCQAGGVWQSKNPYSTTTIASTDLDAFLNSPNETTSYGWTNYTQCFPKGIQVLLNILSSNSDIEAQRKMMAAEGTRVLEMFGLTISLVSLIISLVIFGKFRNLWNNRTRIHKNLFIAMGIQVIVRLIVYVDQYVARFKSHPLITTTISNSTADSSQVLAEHRSIESTQYLCETFYILLEYARTSMFLWMFVEGLYLHNMITVAVFQERLNSMFYYSIGWGAPIGLTAFWAWHTGSQFKGIICWWGYNLSGYFWILEGPRLTVIILNLIFLLNIIRVLVTKLRESNSTEAQQVRKAVRAAIVLLPLLGITNALQMIHSPVDKDAVQFAIWSYFTAFLTSFQGFFCALIYCFLNGEVQLSVNRCLRGLRHHGNRRKNFASVHLKARTDEANDKKIRKVTKIKLAKLRGVGEVSSSGNSSDEVKFKQNDPMQKYWDEDDLSSHNNVDIENIVIPDKFLYPQTQNLSELTVRKMNLFENNCEKKDEDLDTNSVSTLREGDSPSRVSLFKVTPQFLAAVAMETDIDQVQL